MTPPQALAASVAAALAVVGLKVAAWWTTGSVGFLSDAIHSLVNLAGASFALWMVVYARRPASVAYPYGYGKAEYFSALFEGALITIAGVGILAAAGEHLLHPRPLQPLGFGATLSILAAALNFGIGRLLLRVGRAHRSLATEGDGRHLMADAWITAGVIAGVVLARFTGQVWIDALVAALVSLSLFWVGMQLVSNAVGGLMDAAWPHQDIARFEDTLRELEAEGTRFANLRTRRAGARRFAAVELHVPPASGVARADAIARSAERAAAATGVALLVRIRPATTEPRPGT
jgi:cation diffusion facilitator family transporter